jgi:chemotaxis protein MotB
MAGKAERGGKRGTIIVRREEVVGGGHHGGAWKVAYADFVTAMMAFFLLMWLLNATTEEQRKGLADYFSPTNVFSHNSSGSGQPFSGHTAFDEGALVSDRGAVQVLKGRAPIVPDVEEDDTDTPAQPRPYRQDTPTTLPDRDGATQPAAGAAARQGAVPTVTGRAISGRDAAGMAATVATGTAQAGDTPSASGADQAQAERDRQDAKQRAAEAAAREGAQLSDAARQIEAAVRADPVLGEIARQLTLDLTPEGLRIQILDEERRPMFALGSAAPGERVRLLLRKVGPVLARLPQPLTIAGHTDAAPYPGPERTNWELSAERANATRRMLTEDGVPDSRIRSVTGNADRDLLLPADPLAAANRRIAIVVLRQAPSPEGARPAAGKR